MSGDVDPRDVDSRERDDGIHDREDEWLTLGRGPGSAVARDGDEDVRDRDDDWREQREREPRDREHDVGNNLDPRDVFMRDLDLPRGPERELVHDRDRDYTLNGSESRTLATVGAFRVVSERDLPDPRDDRFDFRHLEDQGLIIWRSRPSTTGAAMRLPRPDRDFPSTRADAAVDGAEGSIPAWRRTSCELAAPAD